MMRRRYKFSEEQREDANLPKTNRSLLIKDYESTANFGGSETCINMRCVHKLCLLVSSLSEKRQTFRGEGEENRPLRGTEKSRIEEALALKNR